MVKFALGVSLLLLVACSSTPAKRNPQSQGGPQQTDLTCSLEVTDRNREVLKSHAQLAVKSFEEDINGRRVVAEVTPAGAGTAVPKFNLKVVVGYRGEMSVVTADLSSYGDRSYVGLPLGQGIGLSIKCNLDDPQAP